MNKNKPSLIVILGTNASGKSSLGIRLAKKFNGEIVSADSRQVYKGLDIGSGKVTKTEQEAIPHYMLDVVKPNTEFSLARYQKLAFSAIDNILKRKKLPFLVGGTGLYIQAICDNLNIPKVKPNKKLRKKLEKLSLKELQKKYKKIDLDSYNKIDNKNSRRLIRAIEVVKSTGKSFWKQRQKKEAKYNCLKIGVTHPLNILEERIKVRLEKRLRQGLIKEVKDLLESGTRYRRLYDFGLEYRRVAQYLKGELTRQEMEELLYKNICQFAKRQMTWFKRDKEIIWVKSSDEEAEGLIENFL